jgi:hypothetical protein
LSESPFALRVLLDGLGESGGIEVRPKALDEVQFSIGAFPQQEVAQALFAAGADEEVNVRGCYGVIDVGKVLYKARTIRAAFCRHAPAAFEQRML